MISLPSRRVSVALTFAFALFPAGAEEMPAEPAPADTGITAQEPPASGRPAKPAPDTSGRVHETVPDSSWRWPMNPRAAACHEAPETTARCWRGAPRRALVETGFPGIRSLEWNLSGLEPARVEGFHQAALGESPYGSGGHQPFLTHETGGAAGGLRLEAWEPVQPLDTPVTDLHWTRGALLLNRFGVRLHRMVGNRAYLAFDYFSNSAVKQDYDYAFQTHQPYLGAGRDSLSMVIEDTSHAISSRHLRARIGTWIDSRTVAEAWLDRLGNSTSMANPTNPARNDSVQLLYPASFNAQTLGGLVAHATDDHEFRVSVRHAAWERTLAPRLLTLYAEDAAGLRTALDAGWTWRALPGDPRLALRAENAVWEDALWTSGASGGIDPRARGDREALVLDARPRWGSNGGPFGSSLRAEVARRARPDEVVEWLGGADADAQIDLPFGFHATAGAGWNREGAPEDFLFRWQPALGLHPAPGLKPREHARVGAGAGWDSRHLGVGAEVERHLFRDNWLPRVLPHPDVCFLIADSARYPLENALGSPSCTGVTSLPDSLALARMNTREETRDLAHLSLRLALGNWALGLRNTYLLASIVRDPRFGIAEENWSLPQNVFKGQLLWRRVVLDGRLGLQTRWDWEWFSDRYVFASDMDGTSRPLYLDEYLVLDFTAQMEIKTFRLHFSAMNLYHDRYATEPGVHPPGVNFRFGVDWRLRN